MLVCFVLPKLRASSGVVMRYRQCSRNEFKTMFGVVCPRITTFSNSLLGLFRRRSLQKMFSKISANFPRNFRTFLAQYAVFFENLLKPSAEFPKLSAANPFANDSISELLRLGLPLCKISRKSRCVPATNWVCP